jgi:hypothetical protein
VSIAAGFEFQGLLNPEVLRNLLLDGVPGITGVRLEVFRKKSGASLRSGVVELSKIEQGYFAATEDLVIT